MWPLPSPFECFQCFQKSCICILTIVHYFLFYFLAHLSRRLTGELIVYPCSGVRSSYVVCLSSSTISTIFFSETALPIKLKFYVEPQRVGGMKVSSWDLGYRTKMAATPIYGKTLQKSSPEPVGRLVCTCSIGDSSPL